MRAELVIDALHMAARNYPLAPGVIFHSDHGSQYLSQAFADAGHFCCFCGSGSGALRRVRSRSSQVKGACGRRCARALRAPLDLRASAAPFGQVLAGRPGPARQGAQRPRTSLAGDLPVKIVE
jgi:hypothetical protein